MKKLFVLFSCLTAMLIMSSCTTDNDETNQTVQNDTVIAPAPELPPPPPPTGGDHDKDLDKTK